jgi:RNA polymerase primary sigma factor
MNQTSAGIKTYLKEISRNRVLTKDEEYGLFQRLRDGDESARGEIIACNLRLVVRLAQRFQGKGLSLDDLVQEGNLGLMEVINRFDHNMGFRFSTYAAFWIRQSMQVAVRKQGSLIRLPVRKARQLGRMNEVVQEYLSLQGRAPDHGEIAARLQISEKQVADLVQMSKTTLSLDCPLDEEGVTLSDRVADEKTPLPYDRFVEKEMTQKINVALGQLTERENSILRLRFGLQGQKSRSLRNISRRVGLSQEGVRRVEQRALAKLSRTHMRTQLAGLI